MCLSEVHGISDTDEGRENQLYIASYEDNEITSDVLVQQESGFLNLDNN